MVGVIEAELDHNHSHASQLSEKRFVLHGGLIAKVNHSCEPNCGIHLNASGAHDFVARQPITAGQEITFDYAMRNYTVEHFAAHCQCGSPRCRDRITGWKDLPPSAKRTTEASSPPTSPTSTTRTPPNGPVTSYGSSRGRLTRPARSSTSQAW